MTALDLTTRYLGLALKNPLVASASPLSKKVDSVRRLASGSSICSMRSICHTVSVGCRRYSFQISLSSLQLWMRGKLAAHVREKRTIHSSAAIMAVS